MNLGEKEYSAEPRTYVYRSSMILAQQLVRSTTAPLIQWILHYINSLTSHRYLRKRFSMAIQFFSVARLVWDEHFSFAHNFT